MWVLQLARLKLKNMAKSSSAGISLISVLIALALLATTAVAVSRLIVTGFAGSRLTRENFVAIQIAREGLELIRAERDNNWFDASVPKPAWTKDICDPGEVVDLIFDAEMALGEPTEIPEVADPDTIKLYRTSSGQFVHNPDGNTQTIYSRVLKIDCTNAEATLPDPASIEVTSTVSWDTRGTAHNVELKERLFNWFTVTS